MKKINILFVILAVLVWYGITNVQAYDIGNWNIVQYIQRLYFTPHGEQDNTKATVVVDGAKGLVRSKQVWTNTICDENGHNCKSIANIGTGNGISNIWTKKGNDAYFVNGNVGIGTTDPRAKLDVNGTIKSDISTNKDILRWNDRGSLKKITNQGGVQLSADSSIVIHAGDHYANYKNDLGIKDNTSTENIWLTADNGVQIITDYQHGIQDSKRIVFSNNGNVGIGITNPKAKLDVNGEIRMVGKKVATESYTDSKIVKMYLLEWTKKGNKCNGLSCVSYCLNKQGYIVGMKWIKTGDSYDECFSSEGGSKIKIIEYRR